MDFQPLTNVRPTREKGTHLIVNTTRGSLKLTPKAKNIIGVQDGQYLGLVKADEDVYLFKGNEDLGAKLASTKKGGAGDLNFSTSYGWELLGGNEEMKRYYTVSEEAIQFPEEAVKNTDYEGVDMYKVTFDKEEPKIARKSKSDKAKEEAPQAEAIKETSQAASAPAAEALDNNDFSDL